MMWIFAWDPWKPLSSRWIPAPPSGSRGFCFYLPPEARDFDLESGSKKICHHSPSHLKLFLHEKKGSGKQMRLCTGPPASVITSCRPLSPRGVLSSLLHSLQSFKWTPSEGLWKWVWDLFMSVLLSYFNNNFTPQIVSQALECSLKSLWDTQLVFITYVHICTFKNTTVSTNSHCYELLFWGGVGLYLVKFQWAESLSLVVNFISDFSQPAVTLVCR